MTDIERIAHYESEIKRIDARLAWLGLKSTGSERLEGVRKAAQVEVDRLRKKVLNERQRGA